MEPAFIDGFPVLDNALSAYHFNPLDPKGQSNNKVFEATRLTDGKKLALKQYEYNEKTMQRCKNEISLLESIIHENIVQIYDKFIVLGKNSNQVYFTMDLAKSKNLRLTINLGDLSARI